MAKSPSSGQLVLVIPVVLLITGGVLAYSGYFRQSVISASYISSRTEVDLLSSSILQNVKDLLASESPTGSGCPIDFSSYRNLSIKPTPLTQSFDYNLDVNGSVPPACLVNPTNDPNIKALVDYRVQRISVSVTALDAIDDPVNENNTNFGELARRLQISIHIAGRAKGSTRLGTAPQGARDGRGATSSLTQRYQMQIPRTAHFNVIFTSGTLTPLIKPGSAQVQFNGAVLLTSPSSSPFGLSDISDANLASGIPDHERVTFYKPFFTTAPGFKISGLSPGMALSETEFKQTFQKGIITSFLQTPTQGTPALPLPPNETLAWSVKYDFEYGQPLPELATGIACATNNKCFNLGPATFTTIPNPKITDGLTESLDSTCPVDFGFDSYKTPALPRYDTDFTLDFSKVGNSFCGLIAANTLTIRTRNDPNAIYQILGTVITKQIKIVGSGTVIFYNPIDNPALRQPLSNGGTRTSSTTYLNSAFSGLASGLGRPFFTPWNRDMNAAKGTKLWPQVPSSSPSSGMMTSCSGIILSGNQGKTPFCFNNVLRITNSELAQLWTKTLKPVFMIFDSL